MLYHLQTAWLFSCNDLKVIVIPETAVGVFNALVGWPLTTNASPTLWAVAALIPRVVLWNWANLLTFNLANQRLPKAVLEDAVNKSWRPLPSGRLTTDEARRVLLFLIPCGMVMSYFIGGLREAVLMLVLTWMYNDLGGADENYLLRNIINGFAFACHGSAATEIAAGSNGLTDQAYIWLTIMSAVIFTTLQVQDIPDMEGDAARGRRTLPLVHGEWIGRFSVAMPVLIWSCALPAYWNSGILGNSLPIILGILVAYRTLRIKNSNDADQKTYKLWCVWLIALYMLPLLNNHGVFVRFWSDVVNLLEP